MIFLLATLVLLFSLTPTASAQRYVTVGSGLGLLMLDNQELNRFRESYGQVNAADLYQTFRGFDGPAGLRWEVGLRTVAEHSMALTIASQGWQSQDWADFNNGDRRNLLLTFNRITLEGEYGLGMGNHFINALFVLSLRRSITMESSYSGGTPGKLEKTLSGTYKSTPAIAYDVGFSAGYIREPLLFILRLTLPVYTGGSDSFLLDQAKNARLGEFSIFPADYISYAAGIPYAGLRSNIDGFKITLMAMLVLPF